MPKRPSFGPYRGYLIAKSNGRGGKAGASRNRTATVQVRQPYGADGSFLLLKQCRFTVGDTASQEAAIAKARAHIDALCPKRRIKS